MIDGAIVVLYAWIAYYAVWGRWNMPLNYLSVMTEATRLRE